MFGSFASDPEPAPTGVAAAARARARASTVPVLDDESLDHDPQLAAILAESEEMYKREQQERDRVAGGTGEAGVDPPAQQGIPPTTDETPAAAATAAAPTAAEMRRLAAASAATARAEAHAEAGAGAGAGAGVGAGAFETGAGLHDDGGSSGGYDMGMGMGLGRMSSEDEAVQLAEIMAASEAQYKVEQEVREQEQAIQDARDAEQRAEEAIIRDIQVKEKAAAMMASMMGGAAMSAEDRAAHVARAAALAEQHKSTAVVGVDAGNAGAGAGAGGADASASAGAAKEGHDDVWDPRQVPRDDSADVLDLPTHFLHDKQDHAYKKSLATDMVKSRQVYIPSFNTSHPEAGTKIKEMEHLLETDAAEIDKGTFENWGWRRVGREESVEAYEVDDEDKYASAKDFAEKDYKKRVREARLARFASPPPPK